MLSPYTLISRAEEIGLDGIAITEHDHIWSANEIDRLKQETGTDLLLLRGQEVSSDYGHVLIFGYHEPLDQYNLHEIVKKVHTSGGIVIPSHPFRYGNTDKSFEELKEELSLFDAIEALNGNQDDFQNQFGLRVMEQLKIPGIGGSDAHSPRMIGRYVTEFYNSIRDESDLIREIKAGRCRPLFNGW